MRAGQNPARFQDYSLREMSVIVQAAYARDEDLARRAAVYVAYAYHDPGNIPGEREASAVLDHSRMSPAELEADLIAVRATFKAWAAKGEAHGR